MKTLAILLLGIVIGCVAGAGYMYTQLQGVMLKVTNADASRDALSKQMKTQEDQATAAKSTLEAALKDAQDQLGQLQSSKQADQRAIKELGDQLAQAQAAREAAERALAEAKKPPQ